MSKLLVAGTDTGRVADLRTLLMQDGHRVELESRSEFWFDREVEIRPDLIVATAETAETLIGTSDVDCSGRTGPRVQPCPILIVREDSGFARKPQMRDRLLDHLTSPWSDQEFLARVDAWTRVHRAMTHGAAGPVSFKSLPQGAEQWKAGAKDLASRMTAMMRRRVPTWKKPLGPYLEVAACLAEWADQRDAFARGHADRVASLCALIARGLDLDEAETAMLLRAAMLHDIGKAGIPWSTLHQRGPLDKDQMRLLRTHPERGAALLKLLDSDQGAAETVLYHHERADGAGYYKRASKSTPRSAKILAVAEVYDAMTSSTIQRPLAPAQALDAVRKRRGRQLDGECVDALVDSLKPRRSLSFSGLGAH